MRLGQRVLTQSTLAKPVDYVLSKLVFLMAN